MWNIKQSLNKIPITERSVEHLSEERSSFVLDFVMNIIIFNNNL